jgi:hypothetical protein
MQQRDAVLGQEIADLRKEGVIIGGPTCSNMPTETMRS